MADLPRVNSIDRTSANRLEVKYIIGFESRSADQRTGENSFANVCICTEDLVNTEMLEK
jgi:hypothetical protein